jgi:hypothetical protein
MTKHILRIDASLRHTDSITRGLLDRIDQRTDQRTVSGFTVSGGFNIHVFNAGNSSLCEEEPG